MSRGLRWAAAIVFAILFFSCIAPQLITLVFYLGTGWFGYLGRVLPNVHVNVAGVVTAAACLLLILLLGHRFAGWLWTSADPARPSWRMRWTGAVVAIVVLMFVAGIGATGVAHQTAWLARRDGPLFEYRQPRETARRVQCASNLKQIGLALHLYAEKHDGRLPETMAELLLHEDIMPDVFCCHSSNDVRAPGATPEEQIEQMRHGRHNSYVYHGRGLVEPLPAEVPIACEPLKNHDGVGMNVLFGDGHVEFCTPAEAERVMQRLPTTRPMQPTTRGGV